MICQEPIHLGPPPCYSRRLTEAGESKQWEELLGAFLLSLAALEASIHSPVLCCNVARKAAFPSSVS